MEQMEQIMVHEKVKTISGFTYGYGYVSWVYGGLKYATSGLITNGEDESYLYVACFQDNEWVSNWEDIAGFDEVFIATDKYNSEKSRHRAIAEAEILRSDNNLLVTTEELIFPAEAISGDIDGYELYYVFTPTGNPGVYGVILDCKETSPYKLMYMQIMFVALSVSDYDRYKAKS